MFLARHEAVKDFRAPDLSLKTLYLSWPSKQDGNGKSLTLRRSTGWLTPSLLGTDERETSLFFLQRLPPLHSFLRVDVSTVWWMPLWYLCPASFFLSGDAVRPGARIEIKRGKEGDNYGRKYCISSYVWWREGETSLQCMCLILECSPFLRHSLPKQSLMH